MIMNSTAWIHIMNPDMWFFTIFFMIMKSYLNSCHEFIYDFMIMNLYHSIISTCDAYVLSLWCARMQQQHAALDSACAAAGLSTFWLCESQWVPLRAASWSYLLHIVWRLVENVRTRGPEQNCSRNWDFLNSSFAWLVPMLALKHNSRFRVFHSTICWTWWSINIYEIFGRKKITVSMWNLVSVPCSETGPNLRMSHFVDCRLRL